MKKINLIKSMQNKHPIRNKEKIKNSVNFFFNALKESLKKECNIELRGFGVFELKKMNPKKTRNPHNGKIIYAPEGKKIFFKQSEFLRNIVNT